MDNVRHNSTILARGYVLTDGTYKIYTWKRNCKSLEEFKEWRDYVESNYTNTHGSRYHQEGHFSGKSEIRPKLT